MKKTLLFAAAMAVSCFANAQFFVGGEFDFGSSSNNTRLLDGDKFDGSKMADGASSFYFAPYIGTAVGEDYEVGVGVSFGFDNSKEKNFFNNEFEEEKEKFIGAGAYVRRYFSIGDRLSWYIDAGAVYDRSLADDDSGYFKTQNLTLYMNPGFYYDITEHWGIDLAVNYLSLCWENTWGSVLDEDKKPCLNGVYNQEFTFGANANFGSIHDIATDGITVSVCYNF